MIRKGDGWIEKYENEISVWNLDVLVLLLKSTYSFYYLVNLHIIFLTRCVLVRCPKNDFCVIVGNEMSEIDWKMTWKSSRGHTQPHFLNFPLIIYLSTLRSLTNSQPKTFKRPLWALQSRGLLLAQWLFIFSNHLIFWLKLYHRLNHQ